MPCWQVASIAKTERPASSGKDAAPCGFSHRRGLISCGAVTLICAMRRAEDDGPEPQRLLRADRPPIHRVRARTIPVTTDMMSDMTATSG